MLKKPASTASSTNIRETFSVKPLISARNEKTQALLNFNAEKDSEGDLLLLTGFKLFNTPSEKSQDLSSADLSKSWNEDLKLLGVTRTGLCATVEIIDLPPQQNKPANTTKNEQKQIAISRIENLFGDKNSGPGDPSFRNISFVASQAVFSGGSRTIQCLDLKRELPATK
jgi:hypothetical protein